MSTITIKSMIIGAAKAGTSSLLHYLAQHPNICTHPQREMNFFILTHEYQLGYSKIFPTYFSSCHTADLLLAKSAGLMYRRDAILRLQEHNPEVCLILILRHPLERTYSSFWFAKRRGWEMARTFEEALVSKNSRLQTEWLREDDCVYLEQSRYVDYLPFIFEIFEREQVHIYLMEDFKKDTVRICQELYKHFGINAEFTPDIKLRHNSSAKARSESVARLMEAPSPGKKLVRAMLPSKLRWRIRQRLASINEKPFLPPPMKPETKKELLAYFDPYNRQLADLLQRDLSSWDG